MDRFVFPRSFYDSIKTFKAVQRDALYSGIFEYVFDDADPTLKTIFQDYEIKRVWTLIKPILVKSKKISETKSKQCQDNVQTMSRQCSNNVATSSEHSNDKVETTLNTRLKEKDKEKDIKDNPPISPQGNVSSTFEKFWTAYPKKVGKQAAVKAFERARKLTTIDKMLLSIESQKKSDQWKEDNGKFIPNPATWLNQGRWDDEVDDIAITKKTGKPVPIVTECPDCGSYDLGKTLDRVMCRACGAVYDYNHTSERWEKC